MKKGERIRLRREQLGISQTALADMIGESKQTVYKYENGRISNIPSNKIEAIAEALHVSPNWIMGWVDGQTDLIPPGFDPLPNTVKKPLVGSIACGTPITAEENIEDYIDVPDNIHCDFCLLCKGDSMIEAGIHNGDVVYIRKQPTVEDGEIAAVRIDGEATLKQVYWDEDQQILQLIPCNRAMPSKVFSGPILETVQIEGKAVGFTHLF